MLMLLSMPTDRLLATVVNDLIAVNSIIQVYKCAVHLHSEHIRLFILSTFFSQRKRRPKKKKD